MSPATKDTIVQVWRACLAAGVIGIGSMAWTVMERSAATATKVVEMEKTMSSMSATLDTVKTAANKTDAAINLSVLRILEEHTRQIGELQRRDTQMSDDVATLRIAAARMEVELANLRALAGAPSAGAKR